MELSALIASADVGGFLLLAPRTFASVSSAFTMKTKTFAIAATVGLLAAASAKPTTLTFTDIVDGSKCRVTKDGSDLKSTCDVAFGSSSIQGNAADLAALKSSVGPRTELKEWG